MNSKNYTKLFVGLLILTVAVILLWIGVNLNTGDWLPSKKHSGGEYCIFGFAICLLSLPIGFIGGALFFRNIVKLYDELMKD